MACWRRILTCWPTLQATRTVQVEDAPQPVTTGQRVIALIRPEAADVAPAGDDATAPNRVPGVLRNASFRGSYYLVETEHRNGVRLVCEVTATDRDLPAVGAPLTLQLNPQAITLLEP